MGNSQSSTPTPPPLMVLFLLLSLWQSVFHISDLAVTALLRILRFFWGLVTNMQSCGPALVTMSEKFPKILITLRKLTGLTQSDSFIKFVVCPKCHSIYARNACSNMSGNTEVPKTCSYVAFPNHPHPSRRKECGTPLLKKVSLQKSGTQKLAPFMVYAYQPLQTALQNMLSRPGFLHP